MAESQWTVGVNAVTGLVAHATERVIEVLISRTRDAARLAELLDDARRHGIEVRQVDPTELDRLFPGERHQGIAARARPVPFADESEMMDAVADNDQFLALILDQVQDPRNFGACLRSAAAAGVDAVVFPRDRSAPLTPAAQKAAAGAAERLMLVQVTNLASSLRMLKDAGVWLAGADGSAQRPVWDIDLKGRMGIVVGSEGKGLRRLTAEHCDFLARIPMAGGVESLNVSVAAGIFLFEAIRQRRGSSP